MPTSRQQYVATLVVYKVVQLPQRPVVPEVSYDLTRLAAQLFESCMSTNSIIRAY